MKWEVSCGPAKGGGYHVQARTADQFCSFALVVPDLSRAIRGKAADGKTDVFTLTLGTGQGTMNVLGKIKYTGTWPKARNV